MPETKDLALTKNTSLRTVLIFVCAGVTAALTIFVRIPTPATGGYLNIGDMAVIFCGLFLRGPYGALAAGIGSALADLVGGFFIFIPITFVAKGLEAFIAGSLGSKNPIFLALAAAVMVTIYFVAEVFLPSMGLSAALSSLPFNLVQGAIGAIGGFVIYRGMVKAFQKK